MTQASGDTPTFPPGPIWKAQVPNLVTCVVIGCGCTLMVSSSVPGFRPEHSIVAAFVGILADILDGTLARALEVKSKFGAAFDQLADLTCFGIGPSIFYMRHELEGELLTKSYVLVVCTGYIYMACSVARISRELVVHDITRPNFFIGIPTNLACPVLILSVYFCPKAWWLPYLVLVLSYMMVMTRKIPKGLWVFNFLAPKDENTHGD
eukprot:TRINITY_DN10357_c0_g1_i1.p1 TRINITY_DN10357_c0_g1~~TRINITY_DN10357_c0_g1_i1.p1  ORF type:complete len:208 (-),score=24.03 TRINITY_DN10357_c0_g1_i1:103-726(-)